MLDGAARIADVVAAAARDGQPALGITDHGNMYGVLDFYAECNKQGVKPVVGIEAYQAHDSRFERPSRRGRIDDSGGDVEGGAKLYYHLCLLAESNEGYRNLIQVSSDSYLRGFHYKPRCLVPGQEIVTAGGVKSVEDVIVGDRVMTHRGRLRPVLQTMKREFKGTLYGVRLNNRYGRVTWMTGEHPVLVRNQGGTVEWVEVQNIASGRSAKHESIHTWRSFVCLPKVAPDDGLRTIDAADYIGNGWELRGERFIKESPRSHSESSRSRSDCNARSFTQTLVMYADRSSEVSARAASMSGASRAHRVAVIGKRATTSGTVTPTGALGAACGLSPSPARPCVR